MKGELSEQKGHHRSPVLQSWLCHPAAAAKTALPCNRFRIIRGDSGYHHRGDSDNLPEAPFGTIVEKRGHWVKTARFWPTKLEMWKGFCHKAIGPAVFEATEAAAAVPAVCQAIDEAGPL